MAAHDILAAHRGERMNILIKGSRGLKLETVWQEMQLGYDVILWLVQELRNIFRHYGFSGMSRFG